MKRALAAHQLEVAENGDEEVVVPTAKADAMDVDAPATEAKKEKKKVRLSLSLCCPRAMLS